MIKILSLSGSPVPHSSTDIILEMISTAIVNEIKKHKEISTAFIKLNEFSFIPCQACGKAPTDKFCFYNDLDEIYQLIESCDCLLFGSPIYFDSVSAQAKLLIDRCNCFRPVDFNKTDPEHYFIKRIKRKRPGAMVLVGQSWFEGARRVLAGFFKWVEVTNEGLITFTSSDDLTIGQAKNDKSVIEQTNQLGKHLTSLLLK